MSQDGSPNRLQFDVEPIPYFVKSLIAGLSMLIYFPAADKLTGLLKYCASRLRFPDGTTVSYEGTAEMLKAPLLPVTIAIWAQIVLSALFSQPLLKVLVGAAGSIAMVYVLFQVLILVARNLVTNHGSRLEFSGKLEDYIKWQLIIVACTSGPSLLAMLLPNEGILAGLVGVALAVASLVLVAFVLIPYSKWFISKLTGGARQARFDVNPLEMIGMYLGFILFSILIVTIPWSVAWYMKWWMSRYSLPARSSMVAGSGYPV